MVVESKLEQTFCIEMPTREKIWSLAAKVCDPELPFLTIEDLGILRNVVLKVDQIQIYLTPTYSGCPAVLKIEDAVEKTLRNAGYEVQIIRVFTPPWTTDWITTKGRNKLLSHGVVPPEFCSDQKPSLFHKPQISCPQCNCVDPQLVSQFGSTACKALYRCSGCQEPFEYFKCH